MTCSAARDSFTGRAVSMAGCVRPRRRPELCKSAVVAAASILFVAVAAAAVAGASDATWRDYEDPEQHGDDAGPPSWRAGKAGGARPEGRDLRCPSPARSLAIQPDLKRANELPASLARSYFPADALVEGRASRGRAGSGCVRRRRRRSGARVTSGSSSCSARRWLRSCCRAIRPRSTASAIGRASRCRSATTSRRSTSACVAPLPSGPLRMTRQPSAPGRRAAATERCSVDSHAPRE